MGSRRPPPFSLRLTFEERAKIEADAAGMSLGGYIRSRLLDPDWIAPRRRGKFPVKDHRALAQLLAMLGQSRLANNVNQLAKAANTGSLPVTPETEEALLTAVQEVNRMMVRTRGSLVSVCIQLFIDEVDPPPIYEIVVGKRSMV